MDSDQRKLLLIAVTHSIQEPWFTITMNGQLKTWLSVEHENTYVQHFYTKPANLLTKKIDELNEFLRWRSGRRVGQARNLVSAILFFNLRKWIPKVSKTKETVFEEGVETFRIHCLDTHQSGRWKRMGVINHFLHHTNADYLLLTTSSSYVQPKILLKHLSEITAEILYAGPVIDPSGESFVSGAQTILNRKAASLLIENRKRIPVSLLDDVGLGRTFRKLGVSPTNLGTLNIASVSELNEKPLEEILEMHHFRLKSQDGKKRNDVAVFNALHKILKDKL